MNMPRHIRPKAAQTAGVVAPSGSVGVADMAFLAGNRADGS